MKAVVIETLGDDSKAQVMEVSRPVPGAGEVVIEVHSSPINPSDLYFMKGRYWSDKTVPAIPGIEGAGVVVQCGEGAEDLLHKRVHVSGGQMWAEYKLAKADQVVPLLEDTTIDQAATLWVNPMTVMMFRELIRTDRHRAAVQDAANSSLGRILNRLCRLEGIPLINIVRSSQTAESLRSEGTAHVLDSSDANFTRDYKELCTRLNATIAFDCVGGEMTGMVLAGLCPGGVVYAYGSLSEQPCNGIQAEDIMFHRKRVEGRNMPSWLSTKTALERQKLYVQIQEMMGTVFEPTFRGHFSLDQIQAALTCYKANMSAGKVLLHPHQAN